MGDRCTGDCCRAFQLPLSPEQLRESYLSWREQREPDRAIMWRVGIPEDIWLLYPMLVHLGHLAGGRPPSAAPALREWPAEKKAHWYTCRHLSAEGDCQIYDIRPQLCRGYPYEKPCEYAECGWDLAKAGGAGGAPSVMLAPWWLTPQLDGAARELARARACGVATPEPAPTPSEGAEAHVEATGAPAEPVSGSSSP